MSFLSCTNIYDGNLIFNTIYYIGYYCFIIFLIFLFFSCFKHLRNRFKNKGYHLLGAVVLLLFCFFIYFIVMLAFNLILSSIGVNGEGPDFVWSCEYVSFKVEYFLSYIFGMFNIYILSKTLINKLKVKEKKKKKIGIIFLIGYLICTIVLYPILDNIAPDFDLYKTSHID